MSEAIFWNMFQFFFQCLVRPYFFALWAPFLFIWGFFFEKMLLIVLALGQPRATQGVQRPPETPQGYPQGRRKTSKDPPRLPKAAPGPSADLDKKGVGTEKGRNAIRAYLLALLHTFKGPTEPF